ncbi:tyrosine-type recombinase/integrase [Acinetobacter soli]|uniref:tyrosine-type recombinase/integrase n=1 Tax=Acinetobacter soli TaxID=487316 RepID=UPI0006E3946C|nr:tyrosine-type recombinase/integrase [Acinetobacter soli]KQD02435.1 integrase [Acinetobacter soli]
MLSDTKIKSLKPTDKIYRVIDSLGLYIEVRPNNRKYWRYRFQWEKKTTMMGLGEYPMVMLAEARKKRDEAKTLLESGINPIEHRDMPEHNESEKITTFKEIAEEFIEKRLANKSPTYLKNFKGSLERDIYPKIGSKDVKQITSADILLIMQTTVKRVRRRKMSHTGEVTAIQNRTFIGTIMRYAIATLRAEYDPTYAVRDVVERPEIDHARPMTKQESIKLIVNLKNYKGSTTVKNAGMLMLYTMLRTVEIRKMEWSFIDFDEKIITFPKHIMKKRRVHIVPLSEQAFKIILEQKSLSGQQEYVFPSVYKKGMLSATTLNRMLENIGLSEVTAHDFRATASTILNEMDYDEKLIEKQLAHAESNKTKASYDHSRHLSQRRMMLQEWANMVDSWED